MHTHTRHSAEYKALHLCYAILFIADWIADVPLYPESSSTTNLVYVIHQKIEGRRQRLHSEAEKNYIPVWTILESDRHALL